MTNPTDDTSLRLLEAATAVFLEKGFSDASVRSITQRAGVNIAAVNYHFQDKAGLYAAVLRTQFESLTKRMPALPSADVALDEFLGELYRNMLGGSCDMQASPFHRLMAMEEASPSGVLARVWVEVVKPRHDELIARLAQETGIEHPGPEVHRLAKAVIDIGKGYARDRETLAAIAPVLYEGPDWVSTTADALVDQARDLIDGLRRRHSTNKKNKPQ